MYHTLVYSNTAVGVNASNTDLTVPTGEADFTPRNGHITFTEAYRLATAALVGASVTRGRFQVPTWNAIGEFTLNNANRSATIPSNPQHDLWLMELPPIPQNEEFQVQVSGNLGAATEHDFCVLNIVPPNWSLNLPKGVNVPGLPSSTLQIRASFTLTPTVGAWSGSTPITLSSSLRGGSYSIIGCRVQGTNAGAWRIVFPRVQFNKGRKLRPGGLIQNAIGDVTDQVIPEGKTYLGELGRFHTFELPQFDLYGITAGAITYQVFLDLVYLGDSTAPLESWAAQAA